MAHGFPGRWDIQEDSVSHMDHTEATAAYILGVHSHPLAHPMLLELLPGLVCPLLVELYRV